jgi:ABC-type glycerol-3-phosphate transport system permease component|uniref:Uncharacterized protein n=1 Tax=viral metagenome TaxID=1070528 RepID=A0A6C0BQH6_9ZZZZ
MPKESVVSIIQKNIVSLFIITTVCVIFLFSILCMMSSYVKENNKQIRQIETFIEQEKQIDHKKKNADLKSFEKIDSMFNKGKFSLACCPSAFSTDKGCLCVDEETKHMMDTRGKNTQNPHVKCK